MNFCRWPIFSPAWVSWLASFAGSLFCRLASAAASVSPAASKAAYLSPSPSSSSSGLTVLAAGAAGLEADVAAGLEAGAAAGLEAGAAAGLEAAEPPAALAARSFFMRSAAAFAAASSCFCAAIASATRALVVSTVSMDAHGSLALGVGAEMPRPPAPPPPPPAPPLTGSETSQGAVARLLPTPMVGIADSHGATATATSR